MKWLHIAAVALLCAMPASSYAWWQSIQQVGVAGGGGGGAVTLDPTHKGPNLTLSGGNLIATSSATANDVVIGTSGHSSGKFYFEVKTMTFGGFVGIGFANVNVALSSFMGTTNDAIAWITDGRIGFNNVFTAAASSIVSGGGADVAIDFTAKLIWVRNAGGVWNGSGLNDPATGTGGFSFSGLNAGPYFPAVMSGTSGDTFTVNFGATAYTDTPPTGFGNF